MFCRCLLQPLVPQHASRSHRSTAQSTAEPTIPSQRSRSSAPSHPQESRSHLSPSPPTGAPFASTTFNGTFTSRVSTRIVGTSPRVIILRSVPLYRSPAPPASSTPARQSCQPPSSPVTRRNLLRKRLPVRTTKPHPTNCSFFQIGTVFFSVSINHLQASKAAPRCALATTTSTLVVSPTTSRPQPMHQRNIPHPELSRRLRSQPPATASVPSPHKPHNPDAASSAPACYPRTIPSKTHTAPSSPAFIPATISATGITPRIISILIARHSPEAAAPPHRLPAAPSPPAHTPGSPPPPPFGEHPAHPSAPAPACSSSSPTDGPFAQLHLHRSPTRQLLQHAKIQHLYTHSVRIQRTPIEPPACPAVPRIKSPRPIAPAR